MHRRHLIRSTTTSDAVLSAVQHLRDFGSRAPTAGTQPRCIASVTEDIDSNRCAALGECIGPTLLCPTTDDTLLEAGLCEKIINCGFGTPEPKSLPTVHPAASAIAVCRDCIEDEEPQPEPDPEPNPNPVPAVGCADGTREGFQDLSAYQFIAGCSGAGARVV